MLFKLTEIKEDETLPTGELSEAEVQMIRKMIRDEYRTRWFWATVRVWVGWAVGTVTVLWASQEYIIKIFKAIFIKG